MFWRQKTPGFPSHSWREDRYIKRHTLPDSENPAERRYINYDENTQLYFLGIACSILSRSFFEKSYWLKMVHREMNNIVNECNEVCQMGILDGPDVLYIDKVQSAQKFS